MTRFLHGFTRVGELSAAGLDLPDKSGSPSPTNADLSRAKPVKTQGLPCGHAGPEQLDDALQAQLDRDGVPCQACLASV